jgi:putative DNA primase/helicase
MSRSSAASSVAVHRDEEGFDGTNEFTDLGNARRFVESARGRLVHVPASGWGWLAYDGKRWARDSRGQAMELAARVVSDMGREAETMKPGTYGDLERRRDLEKHAVRSQSRERLRAMIDIAAEALPDLKAKVEDFDQRRDLLNCLNGTVDLRTGRLCPHDPEDRITQLVQLEYDPSARAPLWDQTLREVLPDDEVRAFFQRAMGYTATGFTSEHSLFFCFGGGRNGKSLVVGTALAILGDYAAPAPPNVLMKTNVERHATEIQDLRGSRLVKVDETGRGKAWNEERVKQLTGGDKLKARRLYEDFDAGFDPTHKFWVLSNYQPRVSGTDDGIWSRLKLIEFPVRFCEPSDVTGKRAGLKVQTSTLRDDLKNEAPGILRWIVDGAVNWSRDGLRVPQRVREATADYRDEQDVFGEFIEGFADLRDLQPGRTIPLREVVRAYQNFAMGNAGAESLNSREVAAELRRRGFRVRPGAKGARVVERLGGGQ